MPDSTAPTPTPPPPFRRVVVFVPVPDYARQP
jgi:hypothetical protein